MNLRGRLDRALVALSLRNQHLGKQRSFLFLFTEDGERFTANGGATYTSADLPALRESCRLTVVDWRLPKWAEARQTLANAEEQEAA